MNWTELPIAALRTLLAAAGYETAGKYSMELLEYAAEYTRKLELDRLRAATVE